MATINEIIQSAVDRVKLKGSETWIKWSFWTRAKDVELNSGKNVETAVSELDENISNEIDRATDRENEIETALNSEITRAKNAESTLSTSINNEITRAKNAESTLETNKVPITRTINGKALSSNITLSSSDVGADASGSANTALTNAKAYTDTKVADLVNSAPETLDTLGEIADALKDNADIVDVLNESIATKANASDLTSHTGNTTVHITSTERTNWNDANSKKHTHSNKTVLDNTTASYTTADKTKLDGIATSAEVNQNAFSNVVIGSTTIAADSKTDSLTLAGSNVTLTPDATNDKVTIGITKANVTSALGYTPPTTNTTYGVATSSTLGLVKSGTDITVDSSGNVSVNDDSHNHVISNVDGLQTTLDGKAVKKELISENLNDIKTPGFYNAGGGNTVTNKPSGMDHFGLYVVKRASGDYYTQILIDSNKKQYRRHCENGTWGSWAEDKLTDTNTTYSAATTSASGLMTAAMVTKLNGIATGANAYSHPTSSGNKHIPSGGSSGQILRWSADGTAVWGNDNNTTYSNFVKSGSGAKAGLVPAPSTTAGTTKYLREDGTWAVPPNTTYTSLKNPYTLTIQGNGTTLTNGTYDGSAAKTVNITPSSIGAAASSHTHSYLPLSGGTLTGDVVVPSARATIDGSIPYAGSYAMYNISSISSIRDYKTYLGSFVDSNNTWYNLISIRHRNGYGDGISYGMYLKSVLTTTGNLTWGKQYGASNWQAERTILDSSNYSSYCAASNHTHNYAGSSSAGGAATTALTCTGNSATATKLATARTISLTGSVTGSGSFDGSGNLSIATTTNHTHSYIPLSGSSAITGNLEFSNSGTTTRGVIGTVGSNDYWRIVGGATADNAAYLEIATADDGSEPIYVRQYSNGKFGTLARTATLLDGSGNTTFPGKVTASSFAGALTGNVTGNVSGSSGSCTGNSATATKLKTARTISLTGSVTGSGTFDGSGNLSIATTTNHSHNYLPLSGGTMTGNILSSGSNLGNYSYPFNNAHIKYSLNLTDSTACIYSNVAGNVLNTYNSYDIPYGTLPKYVTDKGIVFGNTSASSIYRGDYIEINSYSGWISANTSISVYSDEKVKNFTEDIETDEDKLIKIFDEIILRSYTYKSSKNNSLSIGLSGQELEQLCLDNDIDPEKYNFLNIRYNYRLDNGDGEENTKFYLKFITISYEELYALALLKIKRMEKEHISRLNQSETEIAELKTEMSEVNDKLNEIMTLLNSN